MAQTTTTTGHGINAANLYENMHVKNVDKDHIPAFSSPLLAEFGAAHMYNYRDKKRKSTVKYSDKSKATDHASPLDW